MYHKNVFESGGFRIPTTMAYLIEENQSKAFWVGSDEELKNMTDSDVLGHYIESYPDTELSDGEILRRVQSVYSFGIEKILEDFSDQAIMDGVSFWWQGDIYHTDGEFDKTKPFDPQYEKFIQRFKEGE